MLESAGDIAVKQVTHMNKFKYESRELITEHGSWGESTRVDHPFIQTIIQSIIQSINQFYF